MSKLYCLVRLGEVPLHLYQILAGFHLLARQGVIDLQFEKLKKDSLDQLPYNMLEVNINNDVRVLYDLNDGYDNLLVEGQDYASFMDNLVKDFDYCFKRSFSKSYNQKLQSSYKFHPLGLNYMVTCQGNIAHQPMPNDPSEEKVKKLIRMLPFSQYYNGQYYNNSFECMPIEEARPKILFMARLWDTAGDYEGQISGEKKEERACINEMRANCIRLCRKEFGDYFYGGVNPTKFACYHYPDIVIANSAITKRNYYLKIVKESAICISTMGLHESIGWKFGEYVAASKAIVTEELHYQVPGDFKEGQNYLVFKSPVECVEQINKLITSPGLIQRMMVKNYEYYHQNVRPDRLVLNSLLTVLREKYFQNGGIKVEADPYRIYTFI